MSVDQINKGVSKPIVFKGLKAQYIWYLAGGLVALLVLFAILYISGVNSFVALGTIGIFGAALFAGVYKMSNTYGEFGLMKKAARRSVPPVIKIASRKIFKRKE